MVFSLVFLHNRSEFAVSLSHLVHILNYSQSWITGSFLWVCLSLRVPMAFLTLMYILFIPVNIYYYFRGSRNVDIYSVEASLENFRYTGSWNAADTYYRLEEDFLIATSGDLRRFFKWHGLAAVGVSVGVILQHLAIWVSGSPIRIFDIVTLLAFTLYLPASYYIHRRPIALWFSRVKASYRGTLKMAKPLGWREYEWKREYWKKVV